MKAGKALDSRKAEIRVQFKDVPGDIFKCKNFQWLLFFREVSVILYYLKREGQAMQCRSVF
jgi:glucose-6-phosphate 1-dehydrogenase